MATALELLQITELGKVARGEVGRPLDQATLDQARELVALRALRAGGRLSPDESVTLRADAYAVGLALQARGLPDVLDTHADAPSLPKLPAKN